MKATLEFDCNEENDGFLLAAHASELAAALWDIGRLLHDMEDDIPEKIYDRLFEELDIPAMEYYR